MSARKRPLAEISQSYSTPSRYAPSTPHAIRALQQRSGAKTRSLRFARHANAETARPDSIRGVLRRFAKISAPITKKRISTPLGQIVDKENRTPADDENDSAELKKPSLTLAIDDSIEEDDSELPIAPTPSVLPDDEDYEQPIITFQNVARIPLADTDGQRTNRRASHVSTIHSEPLVVEEQEDQNADITLLTERGRRAVSEEATGRFSRYSFGTIRMSDFGSELEIRRDSDKHEQSTFMFSDGYIPLQPDDSFDDGGTETIRRSGERLSPEAANDTIHLSLNGDEQTFQLDMPLYEDDTNARSAFAGTVKNGNINLLQARNNLPIYNRNATAEGEDVEPKAFSRRQTLLEMATTNSHATRRKRMKVTRHGITIPSLPASLVKRVVLESYEKQSKRKPKLGQDHMRALEQATEWFFEQAGEDLAAYSSHGRRKKRVSTDDVLLLMRRQKVLAEDGELSKLAKSWLPKEILNGLNLPDTV